MSQCIPEEDMQQERVCNQLPCVAYLWQVGPWSSCVRLENATGPCGLDTGLQTRQVHCEQNEGERLGWIKN